MTDTTTTVKYRFGCVPIPDGQLPCGHCGIATPNVDVTDFPVVGREIRYADGSARLQDNDGRIRFGLCDACRAREARANALIDQFPAIAHRLGSRSIALHRVWCALDAFSAANAKLSRVDETSFRRLLADELLSAGVTVRWYRRFTPVRMADASMRECAERPWIGADLDAVHEARRAVRDWLAYRLPPVPIPCPTTACAMCGIGSVMALRPDAATVWTRHGKGHLCPDCLLAEEDAHERALVPLDHAIMQAIDPDRRIRSTRPYAPEIPAARPWSETGRTKPNKRRFGHLNLDGLRAQMESGEW